MKISIKEGQLFATFSFSVDELKPVLAHAISKTLVNRIDQSWVLEIRHETDDDGNLINLNVEVEILPPDEPA